MQRSASVCKRMHWLSEVLNAGVCRVIPEATYLQLSPSGHCPHAEAPGLFAHSVAAWARQLEQGAEPLLPIGGTLQVLSLRVEGLRASSAIRPECLAR